MKRIICVLCLLCCGVAFADTETINWYVDGNVYNTTTCEIGGDIILPNPPEKYGYTFQGWREYIPIEYLFSSTAAGPLIDTGYLINENIRIQAKFFVTNRWSNFFGCIDGLSVTAGGNLEFHYGDVTYGLDGMLSGNNAIEIDWNKNVINYSIDGKNTQTLKVESNNFKPCNMYLFGSGKTSVGVMRLYYLQIYDNDILVRDFIPVLDEDGIPSLYDSVENKFYYNVGTGEFVAGPVTGE